MGLIIAILLFILVSILGGFAFFTDYKKGQKLTNVQKFVIGLLAAIFLLGIWNEVNKDISGKADKKEVVDTVSNKTVTVTKHIDSTGDIISRKIDSARKAITDSAGKANDRIVAILQKTIREQARALDSLGRLHAEKHLTNSEKKDILAKIKAIEKDQASHGINANKNISIWMTANSNGTAFSTELKEFLYKSGYKTPSSGFSPTNDLQGYSVEYYGGDEIKVVIGVFKL